MRRRWIRLVVPLVLCAAGVAFAFSTGPPASETGSPAIGTAPAEATCRGCHTTNPLNSGGSVTILNAPAVYKPDSTYILTVELASTQTSGSAGRKWGFELTAANGTTGAGYGTLALTFADTTTTRIINGAGSFSTRRYGQHISAGTRTGAASPVSWTMRWTAPNAASSTAEARFFAAGNAANGDLCSVCGGDHIYTTAESTFGGGVVVGIEPARRLPTTLAVPYPNPMTQCLDLQFNLERPGEMDLAIYDLMGRRVRTIVRERRGEGSYSEFWDGRDDRGLVTPNGVYFVRFRGPGLAKPMAHKIVRALK